jgi:hypothetical protein
MSSSVIFQPPATPILSKLPNDYFFEHLTLLEIRLANHNLSSLPLSISQCTLLLRINISGNLFSKPPAILFSCPFLRSNPHNIIFGEDQHCTPKLMYEVLKECHNYNQSILTFVKYRESPKLNKVSKISISANLTSLEFFYLVKPEISNYVNHFFIVRTIDIGRPYILSITPDFIPIFLYNYPGAIFSIELKSYFPEFCGLKCFNSYFRQFIERQNSFHESQELTSLLAKLSLIPFKRFEEHSKIGTHSKYDSLLKLDATLREDERLTSDNLSKFEASLKQEALSKLTRKNERLMEIVRLRKEELSKIGALLDPAFTIFLSDQSIQQIVIVVSKDTVRVITGDRQYYVFKRSTIGLQTFQKQNELFAALCFGSRTLTLDSTKLENIIPFIEFLGIKASLETSSEIELPEWKFTDLAVKTIVLNRDLQNLSGISTGFKRNIPTGKIDSPQRNPPRKTD